MPAWNSAPIRTIRGSYGSTLAFRAATSSIRAIRSLPRRVRPMSSPRPESQTEAITIGPRRQDPRSCRRTSAEFTVDTALAVMAERLPEQDALVGGLQGVVRCLFHAIGAAARARVGRSPPFATDRLGAHLNHRNVRVRKNVPPAIASVSPSHQDDYGGTQINYSLRRIHTMALPPDYAIFFNYSDEAY